MLYRKLLIGSLAAALLLLVGHQNASGNAANLNYLTFPTTMALPGVTLPAGVYAFEFANPDSGNRVVRVSSRDRRNHYFQDFVRPIERPRNLDAKSVVTLGEAAPGQPIPIRAWFPLGLSTGYEFIYR